MILIIVVACLLSQGGQAASAVTAPPQAQISKQVLSSPDLLKVKRIYVDSFGDDPISKEMQSMIVSALVASKQFVVTENRDRADAVLKGTALEKTSQELHAYGESTAVGSAHGAHSGSIDGSSRGGFSAHNAAISDSSTNTETIDSARVAIRLVNADGDVIWTTTEESQGAKYKGASADAADLCVKQLMRDVAKAEAASGYENRGTKPN
jgi:curli biogenesis system outer membrane secretion channel CsgG